MSEKKSFNELSKIIFEDFDQPPWPCFTRPYDEELFSSWLTRVARRHLLRFYSFCSSRFSGHEFWNRDFDRFLPQQIQEVILKQSITQEELDRTLLTSFEGNIFLTTSKTHSFWITPFSLYENTRRHAGRLMVCPQCLQNDGDSPYFRKLWRLTISTVCEKCSTVLIDRCPNCGSEINYLHAERGKKLHTPLFPISYCWKCLFDLSEAKTKKATLGAVAVQKKLLDILRKGYDEDHHLNYSHLYFDVLKKIITILNSSREDFGLFRSAIDKKGHFIAHTPLDNKLNSFETLNVSARASLLMKATWLLENWPIRFREITKGVNLRSKFFLDDFKNCPNWFYQEVNQNNRLVFAKWRNNYPNYSYSSFSQLAVHKASKLTKKGEDRC
jgi:hypothetical protein